MSAAQPFSHPFMYWVGMETDSSIAPAALAEFNRFYSTTHVHEVIAAHPGFVGVSRYELAVPDAPAGPRWLAVYEMADESAAEQYIKDNARPWLHRKQYSPWPPARRKAKITWRMIWRQVSTTGEFDRPAESVLVVGTNVPAETDTAGGTRYELYRGFAPPEPGCPRFCVVSETDADRPPPDEKQDEALWRLVYRRIPPS